MAHNLEYVTDQALSALVIGDSAKNSPVVREVRITKLGGFGGRWGIRIKTRRLDLSTRVGVTEQVNVDVRGEDLYALREFLAELPEEAFVRPADPVEKPDRWTDGDIVEEFYGRTQSFSRVRVRRGGGWQAIGVRSALADADVEVYIGYGPKNSWRMEIIRQASGQDL